MVGFNNEANDMYDGGGGRDSFMFWEWVCIVILNVLRLSLLSAVVFLIIVQEFLGIDACARSEKKETLFVYMVLRV